MRSGLKVITGGPPKRKAGKSESENMTTKPQEAGVMYYVKECRLPLESGKGEEADSPRSFQKNAALHLDLRFLIFKTVRE